MTEATIKGMQGLTDKAIASAIELAKNRIRALATKYTPVKTGRLLRSFDVATTPRFIVMRWSATDPISGMDYAKVVEEGRPGGTVLTPKTKKAMRFEWPYGSGNVVFSKGPLIQGAMSGRYYAEAVKFEAPQILQEEIAIALFAELNS
jgi:hypothetical protein